MFQNVRPNAQLFILHKGNAPYVEYGTVVQVSAPKPKYPSATPIGQFPQMEMVVDVTANVNGQTANLQGLPAGADIADSGMNGNVVVACSREAMNNEISMMRNKSVEIIQSVDFHRGVVDACDKMLDELNPEYAAKKQQEAEIAGLKSQMQDMKKDFTDLMSLLKEQLGIGSGTNPKSK